jgi:hypothetical protein
MAGDQRYKQFYKIIEKLKSENDITKAVKTLYQYHDRLKDADIYRYYDLPGVIYWVKQVKSKQLTFDAMITYVMLGTKEPKDNLKQFWGTNQQALRKAEIELSYVKALSRGVTSQGDIDRFMDPKKFISSASMRVDLRNSDEYNKLLLDILKREGDDSAVAFLYISVLGRPSDPTGQQFYVNKYKELRGQGKSETDAFKAITDELTSSSEYQKSLQREIK